MHPVRGVITCVIDKETNRDEEVAVVRFGVS